MKKILLASILFGSFGTFVEANESVTITCNLKGNLKFNGTESDEIVLEQMLSFNSSSITNFNNKFLSGDKQAHGVIFNAGYEQGRLELNDLVNEDKINFTVKSKEKWLAAGLNVHYYSLDITIDRRTGRGESWIAYAFTEPRGDKSITRISHNTFGDCKKLDKSNKF